LLAHGKATRLIKAQLPNARVGLAPGLTPVEPATNSDADRAAASRMDGYDIRWFLDPVYGRGYPQEVIDQLGVVVPVIDGDLDVISTPTDFLGINYYLRSVVKAALGDGFLEVDGVDDPDAETTAMGWEICPQGLTNLLMRLKRDYEVPSIFITENGSAWDDQLSEGAVHDVARISYLQRHLAAMDAAIAMGAPVHGYFAWSFMDNFEWNSGYAKRFGLFYVDYETQERYPKDSAHWYRAHITGEVRPS
jgi:beta-glucosidase